MVFILQKEKDMPQTKRITSATSVPGVSSAFLLGGKKPPAPEGQGGWGCEWEGVCEVTG